ncbi:hypothetical protein Vafri_4175 [Volvox africanus]|uniref:Beta-Casp domain-containing protein n=1 Tax=Volvox africanus TaxID=51714 RepID=A0A8J4ETL6_9CHLO|nr:hypothetical protein Vafri_4175 [Volvox africanus]
MKLVCIGAGPCRCLVLRFRKANILLDCATPLNSALCAVGASGSAEGPSSKSGTGRDGDAAAVPSTVDAPLTTGDTGRELPKPEDYNIKDGMEPKGGIPAGSMEFSSNEGQPSGIRQPSAQGGNSNSSDAPLYDLLDMTPFIPLLLTMEIHAALISTPEALLALPHLLQSSEGSLPPYNDSDKANFSHANADVGHATVPGWDATAGSGMGSLPRAAWHHMGPIRGPVYCTQAALDAAEQLVAERWAAEEALAGSLGSAAQGTSHPISQLPCSADMGWGAVTEAQEALLATCWRRRAPRHAVRYCLDRVRPVRYGQVVSLDSYELTAVPYSSGSGFGHAVWQLADGGERCRTILYLPDASPAHPFAPPLPLHLVGAPDALVLGPDCLSPCSVGPAPLSRPPHQLVKEAVLRAVVAGGSALIPVHATGEAWELLESLAGALASADLDNVPLLYIGPRSGTSLALASVSLEALAPERQAAVYVPQHPFAFDALMQAGRLVAATSLGDPGVQRCLHQEGPAVVLVAADSLLYPGGPGLELLLRFGADPRSLLMLTHAALPVVLRGIQRLYDKASAAVVAAGPATATMAVASPDVAMSTGKSPMRMRVVHLPLRGSSGSSNGPSPASILELLFRLQPRHLLATHRDLSRLQQQQQQRQLHSLQPQMPVMAPSGSAVQQAIGPLARESVVPYGWLHQARVTLPRNVCSAVVSPDLLQRLQWLDGGPGLQLARMNCLLVFRNGAWHADPVPGGSTRVDSVAAGMAMTAGGVVAADQLLLATAGGPALGPLLEALAGHGITRVSVDVEGDRIRVVLDGMDGELLLRPDGAHLISSCPVLRLIMTDCLMKQLTVL